MLRSLGTLRTLKNVQRKTYNIKRKTQNYGLCNISWRIGLKICQRGV